MASRKNQSRKKITSKKTKPKKTLSFTEATNQIKRDIARQKPNDLNEAVRVAIKKANKIKNKTRLARIINIPKQGGFLPLIPIFAGLSALGALSGGAAGIAKAVNDAKAATEQLKESQRHNKTMESIAVGKGLCLKQHKKGLGLFLYHPDSQNNYP